MGFSGFGFGGHHMMPPHHMGHHTGHGMGHGRGGGGGVVPFRAGDWKCGSEGCGYHNFAKNVSCLRCGASRAGAAVVADSSFTSMDPPSGYGMGPPSLAAAPGPPGPFGAPTGGYGSGSFGGSTYGAPSSTYPLPSAIGGPAGAWQPMSTPAYSHSAGGHSTGPFDSRAAEAAFTSAGNATVSTGPSNGATYGPAYGNASSNEDPFSFLSSGLGNLSMNDESRRNGANNSRSPA